MTRTGLGRQILERLIKDVQEQSIVEFRPRQEGNTLHAILAPKKSAVEREKEREKEARQKAKAEQKKRCCRRKWRRQNRRRRRKQSQTIKIKKQRRNRRLRQKFPVPLRMLKASEVSVF